MVATIKLKKNNLRRVSEILVKIVTGSGRLKSNDFKFKGKPETAKFCPNCDLGTFKSAKHIIMQCPFNNWETTNVFNALEKFLHLTCILFCLFFIFVCICIFCIALCSQ